MDLLYAKPLQAQERAHGKRPVLTEIRIMLEKCALSLGITMTEGQAVVLSRDLFERYYFDSLEDIREALKKGRMGVYGFGHNSRTSLNMVLIAEWMAFHLEEKSKARETLLQNQKSSRGLEEIDDVDYEAYRERVKDINQEVKKPSNAEENAYQRFKLDHFKTKKATEKSIKRNKAKKR